MGMDRTIKKLRKQAQLSQKDVAKALGVGQSAVSHWENGDVQPSTDKIPKLARILGVTEQELFCELGSEQSNDETGQGASLDLTTQSSNHSAYGYAMQEPSPDSPYLRSLELAVMRTQPTNDATTHGEVTTTVPLITWEKDHTGEVLGEELMGQSVEVPTSVLRDHPSAQAFVMKGSCINRVAGDGTIVVFDPDLKPTNGRIAIVQTQEHEVIVRRWHKGTDKLLLSADSYEHYADIVIDDVHSIRIPGTVVHIVTPQDML